MSVPRSKITWTDYSGGPANFVLRGRSAGDCEVSPGCANCYAGAILRRSGATSAHTTWSDAKLRQLAHTKFLSGEMPFRRGPGSTPLVFVCDMGDLFHEAVPTTFILMALHAMADRPDVDWQVLTKRPRRMAYIGSEYFWPSNVWAGTSVENRAMAAERIPWLLEVPAKVRFLSMEPLLERVDLRSVVVADERELNALTGEGQWTVQHIAVSPEPGASVNWVIVGGESGPKRRPFDSAWARTLRDQCQAAGVAFFYKQGSARFPGQDDQLDGRTWKEFPA